MFVGQLAVGRAAKALLVALLLAPGTALGAPTGHIITGVGFDVGALRTDTREPPRLSCMAGSAWLGYQVTSTLGVQVQGDYWWLTLESNLADENSPDTHWRGWTSIACLTYAPRAGAFSILGGAGVGHASFDDEGRGTGFATLLGAEYEWTVSNSFAIVPRAKWQHQGSPARDNLDRISVGLGLEWF